MSTTTSTNAGRSTEADRAVLSPPRAEKLRDPAYQAFFILRAAFVAAPILFGIDKFFNWMTYWPKYLWAGPPHWLGLSPLHFMYAVGAIEIAAGVLVLDRKSVV